MTGAEGYDPRFFAKIAAVEKTHFWFCARTRIIASAVEQVVASPQRGYRVIGVGCGTGVVLNELVRVCRGGDVVGMDCVSRTVAFATETASCPVFVGDIARLEGLGQFDVVGIFDVLEHLTYDRQILEGLNRMLKPGDNYSHRSRSHVALELLRCRIMPLSPL